jgi:hypothetical protein
LIHLGVFRYEKVSGGQGGRGGRRIPAYAASAARAPHWGGAQALRADGRACAAAHLNDRPSALLPVRQQLSQLRLGRGRLEDLPGEVAGGRERRQLGDGGGEQVAAWLVQARQGGLGVSGEAWQAAELSGGGANGRRGLSEGGGAHESPPQESG